MNGSFGANGDNDDNEWRQWVLYWRQWRFGKWRHWRSQSPLATMAKSIGANGDRHWRPLAPFKWRQWMSPLAPMAIVIAIGATHRIAIGDNGTSIGATHCRHLRQWRQMLHSPNLMTLLPKFLVKLQLSLNNA